MRRSRQGTYYLRKKIPGKDNEGNSYTSWGKAREFIAEVWPASGKIQAAQYGERLSYIRNVKVGGKYSFYPDEKGILHYVFDNGVDIVEADGVCIYTGKENDPDYRIISIKPYSTLRLEVEKI